MNPTLSEGEKSVDNGRSWVQEKYESFWLYSESHPWRLAQHITVRGIWMGSTLGLVGGIPYALIKKAPVLATVGKFAFRGAAFTGVAMGAVAAERWYSLDTVGIEDRAYRISYNWGQTKWDYIGLEGGLFGAIFLRRPFGGGLQGAAVGAGIGTLVYVLAAVTQGKKSKSITTA